uniref:PITH domain-containing protein n=1 Tax=Globodera pallida TaxID=36090 RepID=A0A183CAK8_GLOPA
MSQIADELLESEDDLSPSWVKVSKNLDKFEEMGDKKSATNWQQIAKIDDQSAPFLKLFELNVLQLIGTDTIILDVVAALSLTMTICAQNGGVHDEKILVNEAGDDRYCVLLYCYKMTAETPDHQQKELVIFGNPTVDGNVPSSGGDQKVVINVELGNLDELPNCQNDELFIYIERARFGDEHAKPTTMTISTAQFEHNIEDGRMTINLS